MTRPELLSPAGDLTAVHAAISNGADAVYLGAQAFGARASKGFSDEDLKRAIDLAHLRACRVFVTVNTLIKPQEFTGLITLLHKLDEFKADALIVQDLGLIRYARKHLPHLSLHASTQMSIHNAWGARLLQRMGVTRVVAARECPLPVLRAISDTGIETEAFVHGALCVSQSGQCLLSSMIGGRSGNRGRCAQPCRMTYTIQGDKAAWLSPRDLSMIERLDDLLDNGITSFKIEGRLKRPEYVAVVTDIYRRALDYQMDASLPPAPSDEDKLALLQIFNRGGFSQGYLDGLDDEHILYPSRVSHEGVRAGQVLSTTPRDTVFISRVQMETMLHDGDHLQIRGHDDQEMIYSGPDVEKGDIAHIRHYRRAYPQDAVYRLTAARQITAAQRTIQDGPKPIPVAMKLTVAPGTPSRLALTARDVSVQVVGTDAAPAQAQPMTEQSAQRAMAKTGDTPFVLEKFALEAATPSFLPVSALNAMRREGLSALEEALKHSYIRQAAPATALLPLSPAFADIKAQLWVRTSRPEDLQPLLQAGADHVVYMPLDYHDQPLQAAFMAAQEAQAALCLPGQCSDKVLDSALQYAVAHSTPMMLDNIGQLALPWPGLHIAGNGIPAWNPQSLHVLADLGVSSVVLSRELSREDVAQLVAQSDTQQELILPVYGRARAMTLNHCPARLHALHTGQNACRNCGSQGSQATLTDQYGGTYPLQKVRLPEGCINHLLFHTPLHLGNAAPIMSWLIDLTTEDAQQSLDIVRYYRALMDGFVPPDLAIPVNLGRWSDGVA